MNNFVKVISTEIDSLKRRIVKVLRFGKYDVQTAIECGPYGVDSNPIKDMVAVYGETTEKGEVTIIGYINKNQKAGVGEFRTFATDANGTEKFYTWMKNDGTMEIGGNTDNLVRYLKLNLALQQQVNLINAELVKIASGITAAGGSYVPTPIQLDISQSKINEIKTL